MYRHRLSICAGVLLASSALVASAGAQVSPDPTAGSPAGQVYELPFESGRGDAAPRDARPASGSDGSAYRSENNFGSSSRVPGVEPARDAEGVQRARDAVEPKKVLAGSTSAAELPASEDGDPSDVRVLALLAMIVLVGVIGFVARRTWSS